MREAIPPLPQYAFAAWCSVKKHTDNFTFNFYLHGIYLLEIILSHKEK